METTGSGLSQEANFNTHAASDDKSGDGCSGFCITDSCGSVHGSGMGKRIHMADALQPEVEACIQALPFAYDMGMGRVAVDIDAISMKQDISSTDF